MLALSDGVVTLRAWEVDDAEWYAAVATHDELIQRFTSESPGVTAGQVRADIAELESSETQAAGFVICDADSGRRCGNIALDYENGVGHVSYWLAEQARGRGLATSALRVFSGWAFGNLALTELRLWTHVDNLPSQRVAERAGYSRDPQRDEYKEVKGQVWRTAAYRLVRDSAGSPAVAVQRSW
jgi:ribosomal-protein-alanine N-acetyltransferase